MKKRDLQLDIAKGLAIMLVVMGHVIQLSNVSFDQSVGFRFIYSFHMPLFVLLSGAAASFWYAPVQFGPNVRFEFVSYTLRIQRTGMRLVIPFVAWTLTYFFAYRKGSDALAELAHVFANPDSSLWFLLCIFYCVLLLNMIQCALACIGVCIGALQRRGVFTSIQFTAEEQLLVIVAVSLYFKLRAPFASVGIPSADAAIYLLKTFFFYFVLGLWFLRYGASRMPATLPPVAALIFFTLGSYWIRTEPHSLVVDAPRLLYRLKGMYPVLTALSGALMVYGIALFCNASLPRWGRRGLAFLGMESLGIYAIHGVFLTLQPTFVAPLILSVLLSYGLGHIPLLRNIFLGSTSATPFRQLGNS